MSQPSSDFPGDPGFDDPSMFDPAGQPGMEPEPMGQPAPVFRKQGLSIYTVMLFLSFVFLLTAAILLLMEAGRFTQ